MSNLHRIDATTLEINSQPSPSKHYPQLRRKENGELYDPRRPTQPEKVYATILDLNGDPIDRNKPYPDLRRTASGHLFQPSILPESRLQPYRYHTPQSLGKVVAMEQGPSNAVQVVNETSGRRSVVPTWDTVSSEQPQQLIEKAPPYTLRHVRHTNDLRRQYILHGQMIGADDEASPETKKPRESDRGVIWITLIEEEAILREWEERKKHLAEKAAENSRLYDLRNAEQKDLRYVSCCRNLRAQAKLDQERSRDGTKKIMRKPLPESVRHRFGGDDYYGRVGGSPSTKSTTGAKKVMPFDLYTLPGESLPKEEEENTESEDVWAQVADD